MEPSHCHLFNVELASGSNVVLTEQPDYVIMDNGIVQVTLSKPGGCVIGIKYGGIDNLLEWRNQETARGYWDLNWSAPNGEDIYDILEEFLWHNHPTMSYGEEAIIVEPRNMEVEKPSGTTYHLLHYDNNRVEVSFYRLFDPTTRVGIPLNIDKRYVLMRGTSGFHTYGIYSRPVGWPAFHLNQTRMVFKLNSDKFHYMAIADDKQREMPTNADLQPDRSIELAYPEARLLTNPTDPSLRGEVNDKYQYAMENQDNKLHGWVSSSSMVGFWIITPSSEFRNGGPMKQNLTSHVGPTCLSMFHSAHYAGSQLCAVFQQGEAWTKIFGPIFIYLNDASVGTSKSSLWQNAKDQVTTEMDAWPYYWPYSPIYPKAQHRGTIEGHLMVSDKYIQPNAWGAPYAYLGLALPGEAGSWQAESKGYQFWTRADASGNFSIPHVWAGEYDLFGWVPGVVGDYTYEKGPIQVQSGATINLGTITFTSPRNGPTIWEIGYPDRTASEFYVPDPNPGYINKLFVNSTQKWRQYGLWDRYTELYPTTDLIYIVGQSDWKKNWFFTHLNRKTADGSWVSTTWQVHFNLATVSKVGFYIFWIATASSQTAALQLRVNNLTAPQPIWDSMQYGQDNAIVRHGIHGLYKLWTIQVDPVHFNVGSNIMFLTQRKTIGGPFTGIMYDYLRLEAPAAAATLQGDPENSEHCTETLVEESSLTKCDNEPV